MNKSQRRTALFVTSGIPILVALLFSLFFGMARLHPTHAAGIAPLIQYSPVSDPKHRSLIMVNNPETLHAANDARVAVDPTGDLLDMNQSIYTSTLQPGSYRDAFDHINGVYMYNNSTPTNVPIGYGILLYNPGTSAVTLSLEGAGFYVPGRGMVRGFAKPLADVLNTEETTAPEMFTLQPGAKQWLLQEDAYVNSVYPTQTPAAIGSAIFSGAVDFTINGTVNIYHLAYTSSTAVPEVNPAPTKLVYEGYVKRIENGLFKAPACPPQPPVVPPCYDTARQYKGMTQNITAVTTSSVNYVMTSANVGQAIPVQYPIYTQQGNQYAPSTANITQRNGWYTNDSPGQIGANPASTIKVVSNDIVPLVMPPPDNLTIDALKPSDGRGLYPNVANWGIMYTVHGTFGNLSTDAPLAVKFTITNPNTTASVYIAYEAGTGKGKWQSLAIPHGTTQPIGTTIVPPSTDTSLGQASYSYSFFLGLPSGGPIVQSFTINTAS